MPRNRAKTTDRGSKDLLLYEQAYEEVLEGRSIRSAAQMFDLCHVSLMRYKKKREKAEENEIVKMGYNPAKKVFDDAQEDEIADYLIRTADIYYGLSPKQVRRLAYELAIRYNLTRPESWDRNETAGADWFSAFMKRNPQLSVRCAQATSLSRATSFNRSNVNTFFENLARVMDRDGFEAKDIYNMDETGITTVQKPDRIVAKKGMRQVGALTSGERGTLVTVATAVNALGNAIPPMFIFPRLRYSEHFVRDGPSGSIGGGNSSGWMEETQFLNFLKHFRNHTRSSLENKVLLLLDNHPSHITIAALDYCKDNGIVVLSFPPHCSHKLQPLDRSVYGPLKKAVNSACDSWMRNNPGQTMTIYHIPSIVATAFPQALTIRNIQAGFRCTGIYPFNRDIFDDLDFGASYVTDRPVTNLANSQSRTNNEIISPHAEDVESATTPESNLNDSVNIIDTNPQAADKEIITAPEPQINTEISTENVPSTSKKLISTSNISGLRSSPAILFSPENVRPLPKAPPRKSSNRGKKKRYSTVYTDTPEKETIRKEAEEIERKKRAKQAKSDLSCIDKGKKKAKISNTRRNVPETDDEEDEDCFCLVCMESFTASRPNETWIQCADCKLWAHEECTQQEGLTYTCHNCESD